MNPETPPPGAVALVDPTASPHAPPGHCVRCRAPIAEVLAATRLGPSPGWPTRLGARLPAAAPVLLLLDSGQRAPIPLCTECAAAPGDLAALWADTIAAGLHNRAQRLAAARATDASELDEIRIRLTGQAMATALRARRPVALVPAAGGRP